MLKVNTEKISFEEFAKKYGLGLSADDNGEYDNDDLQMVLKVKTGTLSFSPMYCKDCVMRERSFMVLFRMIDNGHLKIEAAYPQNEKFKE